MAVIDFSGMLEGELREADCTVVFLTEFSIYSNNVLNEINLTFKFNKRLIPLVYGKFDHPSLPSGVLIIWRSIEVQREKS